MNYSDMLEFIKKKFGIKTVNYSELMNKGALILDVRTKNEYKSGHIDGAINIPLDSLKSNLSKLKKKQPVITCCASGMRSSTAKGILKACGFEAYNGGGWTSLQNKIK
jgi:phage shock protein E